ncbi:unnamed protein product [Meloidogyne enterolobii]|uniref:Uncharacterized protein n=1 Tax=Meloidogyne enterolobii TaxID=390850 RepID=A0ACB0YHQ1_MELEN
MLLTGHEGEIFGARFSHDGNILASVGFDMKIFLWTARGECENFSTITGHKGAIMDVHFNTDTRQFFFFNYFKSCFSWFEDFFKNFYKSKICPPF